VFYLAPPPERILPKWRSKQPEASIGWNEKERSRRVVSWGLSARKEKKEMWSATNNNDNHCQLTYEQSEWIPKGECCSILKLNGIFINMPLFCHAVETQVGLRL
jgi:hypothetical protein